MTHTNQNNPNQDKTDVSPVTVAVVGAAIASGAAVASAVAMNDTQNREMVHDTLDTAKKQAAQKIKQGKDKLKKVVDTVLG